MLGWHQIRMLEIAPISRTHKFKKSKSLSLQPWTLRGSGVTNIERGNSGLMGQLEGSARDLLGKEDDADELV